MATPPKSYFPWLRFQRAVGTWAAHCLGFDADTRAVIWADYNVQRPELPYLGLQVVAGPNRRAPDAERWPAVYPSVVDVQVLPAAVANVGDLTNLIVNGELFSYIAQVADDETTVRDALVAAIAASVQLGVTATPVGADTLRITAAEPALLSVVAALAVTATVVTTQLVKVTVGAREVRVRATAYGAPEAQLPTDVSAAEWIELLAQGTQDDALRMELLNQGYVVTRTQVLQQRGTTTAGADREPRAFADFVFGCNVRRGVVTTTWLDEVESNYPLPVPGP